ncbi:MAG TPA: adenylate/guanylate cyclase domain-containing protein [Chitinophagaceae bacterium]|nr:adenylate/guanylate cyclase domain-containing protein [Chitinophagaceae bacterium]
MSRLSIKNIIGKNTEVSTLVSSLVESLHARVFIEDEKGKLLQGEMIQDAEQEVAVMLDHEVCGWVKGDAHSGIIASLLTLLLRKEAEKKKLGSEVLNRYQEINLMYNFSDKLAQTIDAPDIARITLSEAGHVIKSDNGVVLLWDEDSRELKVAANTGEVFFNPEKVKSEITVLLSIVLSGQSEIISDVTALSSAGIILPHIKSIIYSALKVKHRVMGAIILASNDPVQYTAGDLKLLTTLALQSSAAIESALLYQKNIREAREKEEAMRRIYDVAGKFVPFEFIRSLGHELITDVKLGDQVEKIVTVLFSDIRDYTTLSEQMTPEETFGFVSLFNNRMGPIIRRHHGFVNQYLGDSIMAIFPVNASHALAAAIEMQQEVAGFNRARQQRNQPPIQIGVGMHTGPLIMGITGDADRMDACTISDTVNTASRLESLTKHYKAGILLSEACLREIADPGTFHLRNLGLVQLKGKHESIPIHECFNSNSPEEIARKVATLPDFIEGVEHFLNRSFRQAGLAFKKVLDKNPADRTADFFLHTSQQAADNMNTDKKAGVVEMQEK